jgi:hypothetical protein
VLIKISQQVFFFFKFYFFIDLGVCSYNAVPNVETDIIGHVPGFFIVYFFSVFHLSFKCIDSCSYSACMTHAAINYGGPFESLPFTSYITQYSIMTVEVDMDRHHLHFFRDDYQIPVRIVDIPNEVYFGVCFNVFGCVHCFLVSWW